MKFYNNAAVRGGKRLLGSLGVRGGKKKTSRKRVPLRGGTALFNRAALVGGKKFFNGAALVGGRRFYNGAALSGGWDTKLSHEDAIRQESDGNRHDDDIYRLVFQEIELKKDIEWGLLRAILLRIYLYDNAIASGDRSLIGVYKGQGLQLCAEHLGVDLKTPKGKKQAETLWKYIRDKIHYGPKKTPYPYDSRDKKVRLSYYKTPWVGTVYSYPEWGENIIPRNF